jgi:hypothetical protein
MPDLSLLDRFSHKIPEPLLLFCTIHHLANRGKLMHKRVALSDEQPAKRKHHSLILV